MRYKGGRRQASLVDLGAFSDHHPHSASQESFDSDIEGSMEVGGSLSAAGDGVCWEADRRRHWGARLPCWRGLQPQLDACKSPPPWSWGDPGAHLHVAGW